MSRLFLSFFWQQVFRDYLHGIEEGALIIMTRQNDRFANRIIGFVSTSQDNYLRCLVDEKTIN